jgi:hypothetical protein
MVGSVIRSAYAMMHAAWDVGRRNQANAGVVADQSIWDPEG